MASASASIDVLRKTAIVVALVAAMLLLHRFAVPAEDFDPRGMLALGFVVLAAYTSGELAHAFKLPHITGYLLTGLVLGPSVAHGLASVLPQGWALIAPFDEGILNDRVIRQLGLLDALALGLIALTAGGELKIDLLRRSFRLIVGAIGGHTAAVFTGVTAFMVIVATGWVPGLSMQALGGLTSAQALAVAAVVGCVSCATSPPVTMAVLNAAGARGEMTSTVLSGVVLLDVVVVLGLSGANLVATNLLGIAEDVSILTPLAHIAASLLIGGVVGLISHLYLRYVGTELLIFIVALVYVTTFVTVQLEGEVVLVFIVAGFILGNFSQLGDRLIHEVERLSGPVYVVFFALAGAKLHLDVLAATIVLAGGLSLVRAISIMVGVRSGLRIAAAAPTTQRYAWMGFVSQAGLALGMAGILRSTYPGDLGDSLFSMLVAGVALNEMFGPILLQWGLGMAGEIGAADREEADEEGARAAPGEARARPTAWQPIDEGTDFWGPPLDLQDPAINEAVAELEAELQGLVRDYTTGPLAALRDEGDDYLRALRREFLRFHRRALVRVQGNEPLEAVAPFLRNEVADLGERWRDMVLSRAARASRPELRFWDPLGIIEILDRLAVDQPEFERVLVEPETLAPRPGERRLRAFRRALLRARSRLANPRRDVSVRTVARYHLSGRGPARLEGLMALFLNADLHLADRTSTLFDGFSRAWEALAELADQRPERERLAQALWDARQEVEDEFNLAFEELDVVVRDGSGRAALIFGGLLRDVKRDLVSIGTLDLSYWRRRFGRVFKERNRGLDKLGSGLPAARETVGARYAAVALELELVGLEGRVRDVVEVHGSQLARMIRGRGTTQLVRVDDALSETLARIEQHLEMPDVRAEQLATALRAESAPFARLVADAERGAQNLAEQLSPDALIAPLTDALMAAAQNLTEWYTVAVGRGFQGEWSLPTSTETAEIPFREVVTSHVESAVTRDLVELTRGLEARAANVLAVIREIERVVAFNVELAGAELDVLSPDEQLSDEARDLIREMVLGSVGRSHARLRNLAEEAVPWPDEAQEGVRAAVMSEIAGLRDRVLDGRLSDLRSMLRDAEVRTRLVRRADQWKGMLPQLAARGQELVASTLGEERMEAARTVLGLPHHAVRPDRVAFAAPQPSPALPAVYRRLFSDQALEAGDLLTGRLEDVAALRAALEEPGTHRVAAAVGPDEIGVAAVANAAIRGLEPAEVRRIVRNTPATEAEVASWFEDAPPDGVTVVFGLRWLFEMRPGGFAPLRRFVEGVVAERGRSRWLIVADRCVWAYAARVAAMEDAIPSVVSLRPLEAEELASAILSRHSMSGYAIEYHGREDFGWQLENLLGRDRKSENPGEAAWFRTLHAASSGIMHDALRLWMASVAEVDDEDGVVRMGRIPSPPLTRLAGLSEDVLLTLMQCLRQGWLTDDLLAGQLRVERGFATARLSAMAHQGLLIEQDGRYRIATHLRSPVERVLRDRGWAP